MSLVANLFPVSILGNENVVNVIKFPYENDAYQKLKRAQESYAFRRSHAGCAFCFSSNNTFPLDGERVSINLVDNPQILAFLVKDGVVRFLKNQKRNLPIGFNPIEIASSKVEDNLLQNLLDDDFPFSIYPKYEIDTKIIADTVNLTIDCSTQTAVKHTVEWFVKKNFPITGRFVIQKHADGYKTLLGKIQSVDSANIIIINRQGSTQTVTSSEVYLEPNRETFDDYIKFSAGNRSGELLESIRQKIGLFNAGNSKQERINKFRSYISDKVNLITGQQLSIQSFLNVSNNCYLQEKPSFIFNDNRDGTWNDGGINRHGPYTKRTFDRNNPSICVICLEKEKGQVEQFVRKFLKGIHGHKYYSNGLEGKFHVGTCRAEFFTISDDSLQSYKKAIESAIQKKTQEGQGRSWGLALVQLKQEFKHLPIDKSPYYMARSILLTHQVPVQDFTLELLAQKDESLGYSMNNMALACYAKMGGVPWLLKSSPTISHELVIGIGSTNIVEGRVGEASRVLGITTVFSGDGNYIVSNTSRAVAPEEYPNQLVEVLESSIQKAKLKLNWQSGDTIRIVFHASVKKFNKDEIASIKKVIDKYPSFNIEYAFLKISDHHGIHLFDSQTSNEVKGKLAPQRGQTYKISDDEYLIYLIGQQELKQKFDGHPRGLLLSIHRDSTFKDIKYLSAQLFNFSAHSWRSYFVNPMPVTISYSDLIASNLGWLNKVPGWSDTIMLSKIGQTQWFL